jgi:hypothetical protein
MFDRHTRRYLDTLCALSWRQYHDPVHCAAFFDNLNHDYARITPVNVPSIPTMLLTVARSDVMVTLIGVLAGALLGTRYKVLCLIPIILVGTAALAVLDRFNDIPASSTALTALALGLALQIGYLVGFTGRSVLLAALTRRQSQRTGALAR